MFIGHRIDSVSCERKKPQEEIKEFGRSYDFKIEGREVTSINIGKRNLKVMRIGYTFSIKYAKEVGEIRIKGALEYEDTEKRLKELDTNWEKEADFQITVYNFIFAASIPLIMDISRHIGLPSAIPIPVLTREDVKK